MIEIKPSSKIGPSIKFAPYQGKVGIIKTFKRPVGWLVSPFQAAEAETVCPADQGRDNMAMLGSRTPTLPPVTIDGDIEGDRGGDDLFMQH